MAEPKLSIKQMKESIREAGLPTADLLERGDIDARYAEAVARLAEAEQLKTGERLAKRPRTEPAERDWRATLGAHDLGAPLHRRRRSARGLGVARGRARCMPR